MVAPMAIALRAQGVPIKIVYLGHRYGSARGGAEGRAGAARSPTCRGRTIAIPSRFSDERLIVFRALARARHDREGREDGGDGAARRRRRARRGRDRRLLDGRAVSRRRPRWPASAACSSTRASTGRTTSPACWSCAQDVIDEAARGGAGARRRHRALGPVAREPAASAARAASTPPTSSAATTSTRTRALLRWALTNPLDRVHVPAAHPAAQGLRADRAADARDRRARPRHRRSRSTSTSASPRAPRASRRGTTTRAASGRGDSAVTHCGGGPNGGTGGTSGD